MTKRTLVSMITGALVIGAASTTFAAANPFSDVPADSWAYDAVSKLAADGVVNGYPDGTYQGQQTMTRYEMAQMVAKAMTKTDIDKADKALVDKLAAEFSEELDNLGVRVADLEKKSDNVKWGGELKYYYQGDKDDTNRNDDGTKKDRTNDTQYEFRLEPKAFIGNSGWTANARIRYYSNSASANNGGSINAQNHNGGNDKSDTVVDRIYVEGPLFGADTKLGKLDTYSDDVFGSGMIIDDNVSGAQFDWKFGKDKNNYVKAVVGRYDFDHDANLGRDASNGGAYDGTGDYGSFEVGHAAEHKGLSYLAGYYTLRNFNEDYDSVNPDGSRNYSNSFAYGDTGNGDGNLVKGNSDNNGIWSAGLGYKFSDDFNLYGVYAKSNLDTVDGYKGDDQDRAYDITLSYKGADPSQAGTWGLYTAYRYLGQFATIAPTYDAAARGYKGWEVGGQWTVAQNILASLRYFKGKNLAADYDNNDADFNRIYGSVEFFF
ncbi:S-layer homology domain-containing protein [Pectinatus cerevisiiphilus]|uniref:Outer membrane protein n=1 Tax=Pectinatus cerevisiiphilus TaxID=86956 RepID=A0A0E3DPL7_9FIRM|nr:S-layer homology domain-containing protein [Pectinatus cerevisiiphilus]AII82890.1 Outer membrane protein [Pectinatus cerevisiiphilus]TCS77380.1 S-layer family protein [Pectinatus cerevisiiphilus]